MSVKDLTREVPRSSYDTLDGYPWLARLIDKVRALGAGMIGEYTPYPCGGDQIFLGAIGVAAEALKAEIDRGASDDVIVAWLKTNGATGHADQVGDLIAQLHAPIEGGEPLAWLNTAKEALALARPNLDVARATNFIHLICLEEGHPIPARP
jgi:hypothetical protein